MNIQKELGIIRNEPLLLLALPVSVVSIIVIVILRPVINIRIGFLHSDRIGHFAANTELYICEEKFNQRQKKTLDLFYFPRKPCNRQLAKMWKRELHILPWFWMRPLCLIFRKFHIFSAFKVIDQGHLDKNNYLDRLGTHLKFTSKEKILGESFLQKMGVPIGSSFVCLNVRDRAYLADRDYEGYNYHSYRNSNIQNFTLVAIELAKRGYYVIRIGAKVNEAMMVDHPKVIDYASNGMRTDFMDIYLSANCTFMISTGTGICEVARICRRPMVYVCVVPIIANQTSRKEIITLYKKHIRVKDDTELSQNEIFEMGAGYSFSTIEYESKGIKLLENTPEEIRDVSVEMVERLEGSWESLKNDGNLQKRFRENLLKWATDDFPIHSEFRSLCGTQFLRNNTWWIE